MKIDFKKVSIETIESIELDDIVAGNVACPSPVAV